MGGATATATVETALAFCRASGKQPLRCRDSYGFAVNRFFCPYTNEAARALDDGLGTTGEIDAVARDVLRRAAGPFAVMNLIKPRINLHAIRNLAPLGPFYAPAAAMVAAGEADRPFAIDVASLPEPRLARRDRRPAAARLLPAGAAGAGRGGGRARGVRPGRARGVEVRDRPLRIDGSARPRRGRADHRPCAGGVRCRPALGVVACGHAREVRNSHSTSLVCCLCMAAMLRRTTKLVAPGSLRPYLLCTAQLREPNR